MTENIEQLRLSEIVKNPYQPRVVFDEGKIQELADSILENGLLQPIIVRKSKLIGYELLAGERRFLASKRAGLTTIPAIIRDYSDEKMMTLSILENLQRENLNPIEEARSLNLLTQKIGMTHDEIGKSLGKSRSYVSNTIRILALPKEILDLVEDGKLSLAHARTLLAEKDTKKQLLLAKRIINEKMSVRELEYIIYPPSSRKKVKDKNIFVSEIEEKLKKELGNQVKIKTNKNYEGSMTLHFDSIASLEDLISRLSKKTH
ncbi:ParB/RepB/Spo0J family partition protein [Lactococcus fujiensis]|nr:ParB/RepB/Spo0J family partition protein [Lactococcus fujiensis]